MKYSTNKIASRQANKVAAAQVTKGYETKEVPWNHDSILNLIKTDAFVASTLRSGIRRKENVGETHSIVLDFDSPDEHWSMQTISEWFDNQGWNYALGTTVSHLVTKSDGVNCERFRVILPLSTPVTTEQEKEDIKRYFLKQFPNVDKSCFNRDRYFFPAPCATYYFEGEGEFVSIADISEKPKPKHSKIAPIKEDRYSPDQEVLLFDKTTRVKIKDLTENTTIFDWHCGDEGSQSASAFVDFNPVGRQFVFCHHCQKTWWTEDTAPNAKRVTTFWDDNSGFPATMGTKGIKIFKNNSDWVHWCYTQGIEDAKQFKYSLPRATFEFDVSLPNGYIEEEGIYNLFKEPEYLKNAKTVALDVNTFPTINSVLLNILGDEATKVRFLNWIAYILQKRKKPLTAWTISTESHGTGKGTVANLILKPIFGRQQVALWEGDRLTSRFNGDFSNKWFICIDELFQAGSQAENLKRKEKLKHLVTEPYLTVESKGVDHIELKNQANFLLFTNSDHSIYLDKGDRRTNYIRLSADECGPLTEKSWWTSNQAFEDAVENELEAFVDYLYSFPVDEGIANTALLNEAKKALIELSTENVDKFITALKDGDVDYFDLEATFPGEYNFGIEDPIEICTEAISKHCFPAKYLKTFIGDREYRYFRAKLKLKKIEYIAKKILGKTYKVYTTEVQA